MLHSNFVQIQSLINANIASQTIRSHLNTHHLDDQMNMIQYVVSE
jgi:hypothetical protein